MKNYFYLLKAYFIIIKHKLRQTYIVFFLTELSFFLGCSAKILTFIREYIYS
jgi:hypothetical protein